MNANICCVQLRMWSRERTLCVMQTTTSDNSIIKMKMNKKNNNALNDVFTINAPYITYVITLSHNTHSIDFCVRKMQNVENSKANGASFKRTHLLWISRGKKRANIAQRAVWAALIYLIHRNDRLSFASVSLKRNALKNFNYNVFFFSFVYFFLLCCHTEIKESEMN